MIAQRVVDSGTSGRTYPFVQRALAGFDKLLGMKNEKPPAVPPLSTEVPARVKLAAKPDPSGNGMWAYGVWIPAPVVPEK